MGYSLTPLRGLGDQRYTPTMKVVEPAFLTSNGCRSFVLVALNGQENVAGGTVRLPLTVLSNVEWNAPGTGCKSEPIPHGGIEPLGT